MANKKKNSKNYSSKSKGKNNSHNTKGSTFIMKVLVSFGVIAFCLSIGYLSYHFFVEESDIEVNMSTDKKLVYIDLDGTATLTTTKKYVSDLNYTIRYDVNSFKILKYKTHDIFKSLEDERILFMIEKSALPDSCVPTSVSTEYDNCYVAVDNYTSYYYIYTNMIAYKITVKTPGSANTSQVALDLIDYMLNSFEITE